MFIEHSLKLIHESLIDSSGIDVSSINVMATVYLRGMKTPFSILMGLICKHKLVGFILARSFTLICMPY